MKLNWLSEQGLLVADGTSFKLRKHGFFSGHWTLEIGGQELAVAQKSTIFGRAFEISSPMGDLRLIPHSMFSRRFRIECAGKVIARISPDHPFTRRSKIEIQSADFDFPTVCFAFWLIVIIWRRSSGDSSDSA